ncbi:hypothetical protein FPOAC1_006979 [Fusarium poae]|uniref:hypothetical protein n=1 Tax=Fusarium poae TaxID=36050 RepID=UPI001CE8D2CB|nr:hypothetical protein FPOAC1_006979 [Fusarium poae]KAG8673665.1 hypothetical protein FPOAC1_006979 [Fusarium poae]
MRLPRDAYPFTSKAAAQRFGRRLLRPRQDLGYHRWSNSSFYAVGGCRPLRETLFRMRSETVVFLLERGANPDTTEDEAGYSDRSGDTLVAALENILASQLLYAEPYTSDLQSTLLIRSQGRDGSKDLTTRKPAINGNCEWLGYADPKFKIDEAAPTYNGHP